MIPLFGRSWIMDHDETLKVMRQGKAVGDGVDYVDGLPIKAAPALFNVRANVQPLNGEELRILPEGDHTSENLWLFVQATTGMAMVAVNDFVLRQGCVYQVQTAANWGSYTQARMMRVNDEDNLLMQFAAIPPVSP